MPRDANGNMTLVSGNPVVTGTSISSTVDNATMADLAAEIQDSLSRSGKGGMSAAFKNADGTVGAPGITFTNETSSGWFRNAAGDIRAAILGVYRLLVNAAGITVNGIVTATGGFSGITRSNLPTANQSLSVGCGNFTHTGDTTRTDVTNMTVTLTTVGRPILLMIVPDGGGSTTLFGASAAFTTAGFYVYIVRDPAGSNTDIVKQEVAMSDPGLSNQSIYVPVSSVNYVDHRPAGTYVYKVQVECLAATSHAFVYNASLYALEL